MGNIDYSKYTLVDRIFIRKIGYAENLCFKPWTADLDKQINTKKLLGCSLDIKEIDKHTITIIDKDTLTVISKKPFLLLDTGISDEVIEYYKQQSAKGMSLRDAVLDYKDDAHSIWDYTEFKQIDLTNVTDCQYTCYIGMFNNISAEIINIGSLKISNNQFQSLSKTFRGLGTIFIGLNNLDIPDTFSLNKTFISSRIPYKLNIKLQKCIWTQRAFYECYIKELNIQVDDFKTPIQMWSTFESANINKLVIESTPNRQFYFCDAFSRSIIKELELKNVCNIRLARQTKVLFDSTVSTLILSGRLPKYEDLIDKSMHHINKLVLGSYQKLLNDGNPKELIDKYISKFREAGIEVVITP